MEAQPILKWAGGKRWLVRQSPEIFPEEFNNYIEPFLGGGAVFFHLLPEKALLSDLNRDLIEMYQAIKTDWKSVLNYLEVHQANHSKEYYYIQRERQPIELADRAARLLYLNRTCWNGLYRVNMQGGFNVPIGTKSSVILPTDDFENTSRILSNVNLQVSDFETSIDTAQKNDFVFVDPPYTVKHNMNGFIQYNENLFKWDDQIRLAAAVERAAERGAKVLVLNAHHDSIKSLYNNFEMIALSRSNVLSGKSEFRGKFQELAIRCW